MPALSSRHIPWLTGLTAALVATGAVAAHLSVGFMPGPCRDAFAKGIAPQLEKQGYQLPDHLAKD